MGRPYTDITGQRFGRLVAIERLGLDKSRQHSVWLCRCDCGNVKAVKSKELLRGETTSCGCYAKERSRARCAALTGDRHPSYRHGAKRTRLYRIWSGMKYRCCNTNAKSYPRYGGRGITICPEWQHDFKAFQEWAISHGYRDDLSIDRIDNNKGYSPDNCRWATKRTQALNRQPYKHRNHKTPVYEVNGVSKSAKEWAAKIGITADGFTKRYNAGKRGLDLLAPSIRKKTTLPQSLDSNAGESR